MVMCAEFYLISPTVLKERIIADIFIIIFIHIRNKIMQSALCQRPHLVSCSIPFYSHGC